MHCGVRILFFSIAAGLLTPSLAYSQRQLVLIKKSKTVLRLNEGEYIRFKRKDRDHYNKGVIQGIHRDYFTIGEDTTYYYNVAVVDVSGRAVSGFKVRQSGMVLIAAGAVLLIANASNSDKIDKEVAIVSGAFVVTGLFMQFVNDDLFKIGRKKKITTMGN